MQQFKTESKRILDLMINSIYTNKEIFLRELISNASDAIDKMHFLSLTDSSIDSAFEIRLTLDKENRTLTVSDNGVGMDKDGLEKNLGTIASSGTLAFKKENADAAELIGQFGVGFYSAFMVAKKVEVITKAYGSDVAYKWTSEGVDGYEIEECERENFGTDVKVYLKDDEEGEDYGRFTEQYVIADLVRKYSDYIRYPIVTDMTKSRKKADGEGYEDYTEKTTLNSMTPIWKKQKSELKKEDYESYYSMKYYDFDKPLRVVHAKMEGNVEYTALLFFPAKAPMDFYSREFKKGLSLYSNGVLIMDKCEQLLPDYFGFVRGVIDSSDVSLNISREMLQQDRQLKAIANGVEKKIVSELTKMLEEDRENYEKLFEQFGSAIKYGAYNDYGAKKDELKDLLMFVSSADKKFVTLKEYCSRLKEGQNEIYYACGEEIDKIDRVAQVELMKKKGFEVLYLKDNVDEFALRMLGEYDGKKFKSVSDKDLNLDTEEEKKEMEDKAVSNKDLTDYIKDVLGDKVSSVALTRLVSQPVCLSYEGEITLEMEKVFRSVKGGQGAPVVAKKVLQINIDHPVFKRLRELFDSDHETLKKYVTMLYTQAMLSEGFDAGDLSEYFALVDELLVK